MAIGPDAAISAPRFEAAAAPALAGAGWRRLWRLKWGMGGAAIFLAIVLSAVFAPWIAPHDPVIVDIRHRMGPPAWMEGGTREHVLGTDQIGADLLSRGIWGGRVSLVVGVTAVLLSSTIGILFGLAAGYFAGRVDWSIMTVINVMLTFPFVLLALAVIAVLGPSVPNLLIVRVRTGWPVYARAIRSAARALRVERLVTAARAIRSSPRPRHLHHHPRHQPDGQRTPRLARSAHEIVKATCSGPWPSCTLAGRRTTVEEARVRLFLAMMAHETNTFSNVPTDRKKFETR